jgi:hypothetical protein
MECCICKGDIDTQPGGWDQGHNADPVKPGGRCCTLCNAREVIPERLRRFRDRQDEKLYDGK